ncbi:MAG: NAD(P)/FAD-dependent oxidoreductase, partial [Leptolyngbya sp. SIO3F4]|nr:NAD(P)/FAD-dependent oxidoreductase [Leptolyngbya sp. SIO3F4]
SHLTQWATGTEPVPWLGSPVDTNDHGQVWVRPTLQLRDYFNVFVVGDIAVQTQPTPNTAQAAYQGAAAVAKNLAKITRQKQPNGFRYLHLGDMLALGRGTGGVWSFGFSVGGKLGGIIRRVVYIHRLPTNHHRLKVARRILGQIRRSIWPFKQS